MADLGKPVLTSEPLSTSAEGVLNLAMRLIEFNGGNLSAAVIDALNALNYLNNRLLAGGRKEELCNE